MAAKASENATGVQNERIIAEMIYEKRHGRIGMGMSTPEKQFLADVPGEKLDSIHQLKDLWPIWQQTERKRGRTE